MKSRISIGIKVLLTAIALCTASASAQRIAPDESWRTLDTEHFRVTFPTHLEDMGRRAAERAEWAHARLSEQFIAAPRGIIDLVLTDHIDVSNGFAGVWPSNRITIYARPPIDSFGRAYYNDRLENVIVHELTHIFHIDRPSRYSWLYKPFGRAPVPFLSFPARATPRWVREGIAVWYESALTGTGRTLGTFHKMVLRTAALEGRFESIGQAGGNSPQWPGGTRAYAYGSLFFEHLIQKYGRDRMIAFVKAVEKQWIPYRLDAAGRSAFGSTLTNEWKAWADTQRTAAAELDTHLARFGAITEPGALTRGARYAHHPKVSPDGKTLYYIRSDGKSDARLVSAKLDGSGESTVTLTNGSTTFAFIPDGNIIFAQYEFADRYRRFRDLYLVTPDSGVRRITTRARLTAPSVSSTGWAVAVAEGGGTSGLARVNLSNGAIEMLVPPDPDIHWAYPAISPDGQWIAATRWTQGHHDIVLLDAHGKLVCEVTRDRALDFAPSWSANGQWLVWASDRSGIPNILAAKVDNGQIAPPVMLTNLRTGAAYPSVDPSDRWLYFSAYHVDGWEIERISFNPTAAPPAPRADSTHTTAEVANRPRGRAEGPMRAYSPLETLRPYYWIPAWNSSIAVSAHRKGETAIPRTEVLGTSVGARTSGIDLVRRHSYNVGARIFLPVRSYSDERAAGDLSYRYYGLGNPSLGLSLSQDWDEDGARIQQETDNTFFVLERERRASGSMTIVKPKARSSVSFTVSGGLVREDREALDSALRKTHRFQLDDPRSTLGELSVRVSATNARSSAFQMGQATGTSFSVRARRRHDLSPASNDRSADDIRGTIRTYARLPHWFPSRQFAAPVLALRASAGASRGPGSDYFDIGGAESITFPVRGYDTSTRSGQHAWSASLEYRAPFALENRGLRAWPIHYNRVFWTFFADAANTWERDTSQSRPLLSAGTELITDYYVLYSAIRYRLGVAYRFTDPKGVGYYVRLGTSF